MPFGPDTVVCRAGTPVEAIVGSEVVLMILDSGECYGLGETGSDVWRLLVGSISVAQLTHSLRETYAAPEGVLEQDVVELLQKFYDYKLIDVAA